MGIFLITYNKVIDLMSYRPGERQQFRNETLTEMTFRSRLKNLINNYDSFALHDYNIWSSQKHFFG